MRTFDTRADAGGNVTRTVSGPDLNYFLSGRVVAYTAGSAQAAAFLVR